MSVIERIEISRHRLALDPPFPGAWDRRPRTSFSIAVYRVWDSDGRVGYGAGEFMPGFSDYPALFIDQDPLDLTRHSAVLDNIAFFDGRPWAFEVALWDLAGRVREEPIWKMVGGTSDRVRTYASSGSLWALDEVADRVEAVIFSGFPALKLRFGRSTIGEDLAILERARLQAGDRLEIMVDCNQGWRMPWDTRPSWNVEFALQVAKELENYNVYWMEEPLYRGDHAGMARLRDQTEVRIAAGEMTREIYELELLIQAGGIDVAQPDAVCTGGIDRVARFARFAVDRGVTFSPHTWGSGVALAANAHLTAGTTGTTFLEYPHDPPTWTAARRDFLFAEPLVPDREGRLVLPDSPGLGIQLDEERLAFTETDSSAYG